MAEILLRGYAITFGEIGRTADGLEAVVHGAFDKALADRRDVRLVFGDHAPKPAMAWTRDNSLRLFADGYGLGFEARLRFGVDIQAHELADITSGSVAGASVQFQRMTFGTTHHRESGSSYAVRRVVQAGIEHIALVGAPAYPGTGVWRGDVDLANAPHRI